MSVGLYDADIITYTHTTPNLELMKYATYYKNKGEITSLSSSFEPSLYNLFIYRKDYDDGDFPNSLEYPNMQYGGLSYSNNIYVPLPKEIEELTPDTSIYNKMISRFGTTKKLKKAFETCLNSRHLRLSLDGENIWEDFEKQIDYSKNENYFFHDYDLNKIKDSDKVIKRITEERQQFLLGGFIATKFPIQIYNEEDIEKWLDIKCSGKFFNFQYYGLMSTEYFKHFIKDSTLQTTERAIQYIVTYGFKNQQDFVDNGIEKMYDQYIIACTNQKRISLIYDTNFFENKLWEDFFFLLDLFNKTVCEMKKEEFLIRRKKNSLYHFVRHFKSNYEYKKSLTIEKAREIFAYIRTENYNLFKKFYESTLTEVV